MFSALLVMVITVSCGDDNDSTDENGADCLESCGVDLDAAPTLNPTEAPCGENGWVYPDECTIQCFGVEKANDRWLCRTPADCDQTHVGLGKISPDECRVAICQENGSWQSPANDCPPETFTCFADCPVCSEDPADWLCGADGVAWCNECVMTCQEVEAAENGSCAEPVGMATFCDPESDSVAIRDDGCNRCDCQDGIWHCTNYGCPGDPRLL